MNICWLEVAAFDDDLLTLGEVNSLVRITVRLIVAAALGGLLGYQREHIGKAAGIRTHMLVALGAALFTLAPFEKGMGFADESRIIQGIVAGIGFLGAGAIIKPDNGGAVRGLTTAAGVWLTAGIGVAVGIGQLAAAVICTLLGLFTLALMPWISRWAGEEDEPRHQ